MSQVGGVLLYGRADEEIPFLRHEEPNPTLAQRTRQIRAPRGEEGRGLPAAVHTPHGDSWVFASGDGGRRVLASAAAAGMVGRPERRYERIAG